jgi:NAD(P)-dependent dehydrogenase (short-subunit alcohol dehydrogenase family)
MRLARKVALITGGTSGIGRATSILFAQEGAKIAVSGRNEGRGQDVVKEITAAGGEAVFIRTDVRSADECCRTVEKTVDTFGRIDILFNNAGVWFPATVPDCTEEEWDLTLDVNLKGAYLMSKYAIPKMVDRGGGVIIHNGSGWGLVGGAAAASYCASKGGIVLLTRAMAIDHGRQGIRVNCICPGDVETPMLTDDARNRDIPWEDYRDEASQRPMGRIGTPDEIARATLFLASDDSSFMTGASLVVDGGGVA